jgi:hypothetical protein
MMVPTLTSAWVLLVNSIDPQLATALRFLNIIHRSRNEANSSLATIRFIVILL